MKAAIVVMTIMGCDDSATHCHYIDTVERGWETVALCDAQAEAQMNRRQNENYPVIVAVCESAAHPVSMEVTADAGAFGAEHAAIDPEPQAAEASPSLAARALNVVRRAIPDGTTLKAMVSTPVRYAEGGYLWVVKRFGD